MLIFLTFSSDFQILKNFMTAERIKQTKSKVTVCKGDIRNPQETDIMVDLYLIK